MDVTLPTLVLGFQRANTGRMRSAIVLPTLRLFTVGTVVALTACLTSCSQNSAAPETSPAPAPSPSSTNTVTLPSLFDEGDSVDEKTTLILGGELTRNDTYSTHSATYDSGGLTISAVVTLPTTDGPHPGVVLVHGLVDPQTYTSGSQLTREQDYLTRAGYVVLNTDLRNHAYSDADTSPITDLYMGASLDVINAVQSLKGADLPMLDNASVGVLGHSMGGLLTFNTIVSRPHLVEAAVAFAPASGDIKQNIERFFGVESDIYDSIATAHGTPAQNPTFWRDVSPLTFADRVETPLLIVHGTADAVTPFAWTVATIAAWEDAGNDVELVTLPHEGHIFGTRWIEAMDAASAFLAEELNG
jgi:dipeptidyl aminopeptidase/acylaminoacyl peptidase